jgi:hypothetical protein
MCAADQAYKPPNMKGLCTSRARFVGVVVSSTGMLLVLAVPLVWGHFT